MTKRKRTKEQTRSTKHRKPKIKQHEPHKKLEVTSSAPQRLPRPAPLVASVVLSTVKRHEHLLALTFVIANPLHPSSRKLVNVFCVDRYFKWTLHSINTLFTSGKNTCVYQYKLIIA